MHTQLANCTRVHVAGGYYAGPPWRQPRTPGLSWGASPLSLRSAGLRRGFHDAAAKVISVLQPSSCVVVLPWPCCSSFSLQPWPSTTLYPPRAGGETCSTCPGDCGSCCGNGVCEAAKGETCSTCPGDCGSCPVSVCNKNGVCDSAAGETCWNGVSGCTDCGSCSSQYCGDGSCTTSKWGYSEGCDTCAKDCGACNSGAFCGDGVCQAARGETAGTCARDCKNNGRKNKVVRGAAYADSNNGNGNGNNGNNGNKGNNGKGNGNGNNGKRLSRRLAQ